MKLTSFHDRLQKWLQRLLIILMGAMAINVLWQVATRFLIGDPSVWTEELARFILIWLGSLGAAYGVGENFHLEMDFFIQKASPARRKRMEQAIQIVILLIAGSIFIYGGFRLLYLAHDLGQTSPALGVSMTWVYAVLPLSGILMAISCIVNLLNPAPHISQKQPTD